MIQISEKKRFILLDRDGTLIEEKHYLSKPEQVELVPGAGKALRSLIDAGFGLVLLTNQSGIARGYFGWDALNAVHDTLKRMLQIDGVTLDGIYICPHLPEEGCACRKPRPGLALSAGKDLGFIPSESVVVGDKACDVELGKKISASTILVGTGHGSNQGTSTQALADQSVASIVEACRLILEWDRLDAWCARKDYQHE